ncbi:phage tail protein [Pseudomonas fuscovaginae UPB0736]|uniref:phage tail protein n=1 Tax=Pseudomonas asplenii TaxID=53407 RepID=UPI000287BBFB|nr:phage tail protein [Pseudomonas fuscovaginae]UUQ66322.1 phage tail protein [Pseudomonas fuscovaginae UPB0736]
MDYPKSTPSIGLVNGKFVDENPVNGSPGSLIPAAWGNAVTEELLNVVQAGGLEPMEAEHDQLLKAIRTIIQSSLPPEQIRTTLVAYGITDAYTKAEVEALFKNATALPVGAMMAFPKGTVPVGFLEVDGSVQSIATYPDLAAYLGTTFNKGDEGAGNFRLPESRGEFLRGWDHGRGVDAGRDIGTYQSDAFKSHTHEYDNMQGGGARNSVSDTVAAASNATTETGHITSAVGGTETRPRNISVMWCIKAWSAPINQGNIDVAAVLQEIQNQKPVAPGLTIIAVPGVTNFVVPEGTKADSIFEVEVWGGGAGGAGGSTGASGGGGGAGGGYAYKRLTGLVAGTVIKVTVGAGGTAGVAGAPGGGGGTSSFGTYCSAEGGNIGLIGTGSSPGSAGGRGFGGDLNLTGDSGKPSEYTVGGAGGMAARGGGGGPGGSSAVGNPGTTPGGGGGGGDGPNFVGAAGGNGMVVVKWR